MNQSTNSNNLVVRLFTDPILHTKCDPVIDVKNLEHFADLSGKLYLCMVNNRGVGLAANQVGMKSRFFLASLDNQTKQVLMINPVLKHASKDRATMEEGCLSCPGVFVPIRRSKEILVEYIDVDGEPCQLVLTGMDARIVLHELDHLDGKMIIDKLL